MFESIKKWYQRSKVININFEAVPSDTKLGVLTTTERLNAEHATQIKAAWSKYNNDFKVVVLSDGISLQALSDEQLKAIGLMRVEVNETTQTAKQTTGDDTEGTETT